jgi:Ser/Thr protein kinase RdoA (MazF antagonist)
MTVEQTKKYNELLNKYEQRSDLTPGQLELLFTLACVILEEQTLQRHCDQHGTCYQVIGRSGDTYSKQRPEWQQLKEARHRKQIIITRLENWIGEGRPAADENAEYFS